MGLFDTIFASGDVSATLQLRCAACGALPDTEAEWQSKSLDPCMHSYLLRHDQAGDIRLFLLDPPSDRRFWREWTTAEREERASRWRPVMAQLEGHFTHEAYRPENRRQRHMGELPHQWLQLYRHCACGEWVTHWLKFTDGVLREVRREAAGGPRNR